MNAKPVNTWTVTESVPQELALVIQMNSSVPTADASHPTGSVTMTMIAETILMSKIARTTPAARHSSHVTMAVVSRRPGSVTTMMIVMICLMRETARILPVDQINLHVTTNAAFQTVGVVILTTTAVMALMNGDVRQHQSQQ